MGKDNVTRRTMLGALIGAAVVPHVAIAHLKNFVSVKDHPYLAKGDGATDDTLAFRAAIAAASAAGGGTVWVPPGTYVLDNNDEPMADYGAILRVPGKVTLLGGGRGATVLTHTKNFGTTFHPGTRFVRLEGDEAGFAGMTLVGKIDDDSRDPRCGLAIEGASHCIVRDVHSKDFYTHAFGIFSVAPGLTDLTPETPANYNTVENYLFERGNGSASIIYSNPEHGVKNIGNTMRNGVARDADAFFGLEIRYSDRSRIENVELSGNTDPNNAGLNLEQSANDNVFVACAIKGNANGLFLSGITGKPRRNKFLNCYFDDNAQAGVLNNNGEFTSFIGGSIGGNASRGFYDAPVTAVPGNRHFAIYLDAGADDGWAGGETLASTSGGGTATIRGFDPVERVLYVDDYDDTTKFAVGDTVTQGANSGEIVDSSTVKSAAPFSFNDLDINDNASFGASAASGEIKCVNSRLLRNVDRGLSLDTSCTGVVARNTLRTTFSSSVTTCGDIFAGGATKVNVGDNDLTLSKVASEQAFALGVFVPAVAAPHGIGTTGMVKTTASDSGAWTRSGLVRPATAADEVYCDIPLATFVGYPSTNVVFRFRVKDDGSARSLLWRSDPSGGSFADVATGGSGEWEWISVSLTAAGIEADHVLQLRKKNNDGATVLLDGYIIQEG